MSPLGHLVLLGPARIVASEGSASSLARGVVFLAMGQYSAWVVMGCAACGPGSERGIDAAGPVDLGALVFEETFDEPLLSGRWLVHPPAPSIDMTYGNPAPAMHIPNANSIESVEDLVFAGQTLALSADVDVVSISSGTSVSTIALYDRSTDIALAYVRLVVRNEQGVISTLITCDKNQPLFPIDVGTREEFRTLHFRIGPTGMHCGIDGIDYFTDPMRTEASAATFISVSAASGQFASSAQSWFDNVRVHRSEP